MPRSPSATAATPDTSLYCTASAKTKIPSSQNPHAGLKKSWKGLRSYQHLINALSVRMGDARYPSESRRRERHRGFACSALSPELAYHSFFLIAQVLFEGRSEERRV